ncbi:MAG: UbiD family decarboxylase [Desulfuromonadaceae bacterium]|nr:UbiD family decarboxylase [Desulfuromonadaceae bacterium]
MQLDQILLQAQRQGQLLRVQKPVSPFLEAPAIAYRLLHDQAKTSLLLFETLNGCSSKLLFNLFADLKRCRELMRGCDGVTLEQRIAALPDGVASLPAFANWLAEQKLSGSSPALFDPEGYRVLSSLSALPQVTHWPQDSSPYFSFATLWCNAPGSRVPNGGVYRLCPMDSTRLSVHWNAGSQALRCYQGYQLRGQRMPVAITWGGDPVWLFASVFPIGRFGSTLALARFVRSTPLPVIQLPNGLVVPADSSCVMTGWIDSVAVADPGHFANHSGCYVPSGSCPVVQVEKIYCRDPMVLPATVVGPAPTENSCFGRYIWSVLEIFIKREFPAVLSVHVPQELVFHPVVIIQVRAPAQFGDWQQLKRNLRDHALLKGSRCLFLIDETMMPQRAELLLWSLINARAQGGECDTSGSTIVDLVEGRFKDPPRVVPDARMVDWIEQHWQDYFSPSEGVASDESDSSF